MRGMILSMNERNSSSVKTRLPTMSNAASSSNSIRNQSSPFLAESDESRIYRSWSKRSEGGCEGDRRADRTALRKPPLGLLKKKCFQTRTRFRFLRANRFAREWITSISCEQCFLFLWSLLFCCFAQLTALKTTTRHHRPELAGFLYPCPPKNSHPTL